MIQVVPIRNDIPNSPVHLRTHILTPKIGVTVTLTLEGKKENILSILEDHLLETISAVEWNSEDADKDFTFITEHYNRFIRNLEPSDLSGISIILSLLRDNLLTISAIGEATAYLVEGEDISGITLPEKGRFDFHTLTTGEVSRNAAIYLANKNVESFLGDDLLLEFSNMPAQEFGNVAKEMFAREITIPFHIIRVWHPFKLAPKEPIHRWRWQLDLLKDKGIHTAVRIKNHPVWGKTRQKISEKIDSVNFGENKKQKYTFLAIGVIVVFFLVYSLFGALGHSLGSGTDTAQEQVLEAKTLIEDSQKLTSDQWAFETNIQKAETLLASLKSEQKYLSDVQELQNRIDVLKKEVYGIEIIDLTQKHSIAPIAGSGLEPIATFEFNNKLTIIGKTGMISDYVRDTPLPKILTYPQDTKAIAADINNSGIPFIVSENGNVMIKQAESVVNAALSGQSAWEVWPKITAYDANIYIVNTAQNQVYRYRGGTNGFMAKTDTFTKPTESKILDVGVDGGFYVLTTDGKIGRFLSTNANAGIVSMTLNKIPGGWSIDAASPTQVIASERLSYLYVRNGKKVWIFQPNSRNFRDINALTYVAQIEIQTNDTIEDVSVPRDGLFYITTNNGIYENQFEIKDGKFYLK